MLHREPGDYMRRREFIKAQSSGRLAVAEGAEAPRLRRQPADRYSSASCSSFSLFSMQ
jgi:hypothetical protein